MPKPTAPAAERFWPKVDKEHPSGCWVWTASLSDTGYGNFRLVGANVQAHRWSYTELVGPIPNGLVIDHLCRNRSCVNPSHMEVVTRRVNNVRGGSPAAINFAKTHCIRGHDDWRVSNSKGHRQCRECKRMHDRNALRRKRAQEWAVA